MNAQEHIERISKDYQVNARVQMALQGSMRHVQRSFTRRGHLLMEFIQNAQDASAQKMSVRLAQSELLICNDGNPFISTHVDSLCSIGKSSKTAGNYIGYLGVGFKSTFLIASRVTVDSGDYHFAFDADRWPSDSPWQIMPVWTGPRGDEQCWSTEFRLSAFHSGAEAILKDSFSTFQPRTLLWLDHLTELTIQDEHNQVLIQKVPLGRNRWRLIVTQDGSSTSEDWLIETKECKVSDEARSDQITKDWDREEVGVRSVAAAFRLDEKDCIVPEPKGTAYVTIYSHSSMRDEPVPIHFLIQGDFITAPNRESVHREAEWNKWLGREICNLLRDQCIPMFLDTERWRGRFQSILEMGDAGSHPIWDMCIRRPLSAFLATEHVYPAADGSRITREQTIRIPKEMATLVGDSELEVLFPGKKRVADDVSCEITSAPADSLRLILHPRAEHLLRSKATSQELSWFASLYEGLLSYIPLTRHFKGLLNGATPFILTDKFDLAGMSSVYTNSDALAVPNESVDYFGIVHPGLFEGSHGVAVGTVIADLGIKPLTEQTIKKAVAEHQLPQLSADWGTLDDGKKMTWIRFFKEHGFDPKTIGFISLPTESKKWQSPSSIVFSTEYHPSPDIERLVTAGLLGQADVPEDYLDPVFSKRGDNPDELRSWVSFLSSLGVGSALNQNRRSQLAQRVATNASLQYERARGNWPIELPESESHLRGYDIESKSNETNLRIEAKGRSTNEELTVTSPQWKALLSDPSSYYIYVVTEALSTDPLIHVIEGSKLEGIDFSLRIQSATWKAASREPVPYSSLQRGDGGI